MSLRITMVVSSDLVTDQRVQRHAELLAERYEVLVLGRKKRKSLPFFSASYNSKRLKSMFETGWLFYASYNIKLFFYLLFTRTDVVWANDLDTLLAVYWASRIRNKLLVYDSHEYYAGVPELEKRPVIRAVWLMIERAILPQIKHAITVSDSVARKYFEEYGVEFEVIRNIPKRNAQVESLSVFVDKLPSEPFLLYQGALNKDRGLEELIEAFSMLPDLSLVIAGKGDVEPLLQQKVNELGLEGKVIFLGLLRPQQLRALTPLAFAGLSIEKPTNLNYEMCLPNKLFDYIQAGIPVIGYPHVEIRGIIDAYHCGTYVDSHDPEALAKRLSEIVQDPNVAEWKRGSERAALELNWENEGQRLIGWFENRLGVK